MGPRFKKISEQAWIYVRLCTYRESRQRHLAVHPHVALHLPLELLLGAQFVGRDAVPGGVEADHKRSSFPSKTLAEAP